MKNSGIGWTDDTYNPITKEGGGFYCFKVSAGCTNCYAEVVDNRFNHETHLPYRNMKEYPKLVLDEGMLAGWAHKKKVRKNFLSSMTDVFGEFVPDEWIFKILDAMVAAPKQIFQVLTKRSERMKEMVRQYCEARGIMVLPKNIWLMVSVENQDYVSRAKDLIATRCQIRGLSIEPLLDFVDLTLPQLTLTKWSDTGIDTFWETKIIQHIDWVIVGGESGQKARVMKPSLAYNLMRQCEMYKVPFFFKQWGEWVGAFLDTGTGKVMLEDDFGNWHLLANYRQYIVHEDIGNPHYITCRSLSIRVGKKIRIIDERLETERESDNSLIDGKPYFEFPKYLEEHERRYQ